MRKIQIKRIVKQFKSTQVLKDISLEVNQGELVVLLGPSGCGKTTLLRIIAGLEQATSGKIFIANQDISNLAAGKRNIAMVFQNYAIFPHMTVSKNIGFGLKVKKFSAVEIKKRVSEAMELMHISNLAERLPSQLSGGQRQRVAVARALSMKPEILLMDEPLSNLDALLRLEMRAELKSLLKATKTTTLYVTHDQVEAMGLADRIAILSNGAVEQYDIAKEIYSNPATKFVASFIGNPPMNIVDFKDLNKINSKLLSSLKPPNKKILSLGVRAEHITVSTKKTANSWEVPVLVIESLGSHLHLTTTLARTTFRVIADIDTKVNIGDKIYLTPDPKFIRWFQK